MKFANIFVTPLRFIFNKSLHEGQFPNLFMYSVVKHILKTLQLLKRQLQTSFSPLYLLKNTKKIVLIRLNELVYTNRLFTSYQYGFQIGKGITVAIFEIISGLDSLKIMVSVFCYVSKAFDCVLFHPGDKTRVLWYRRSGSVVVDLILHKPLP